MRPAEALIKLSDHPASAWVDWLDGAPRRAEAVNETPIFFSVRDAQTPIFHALVTAEKNAHS